MKKQLLSFRDFLKTGTFGPVSPSLKMIDIAGVLGPPDGWVTEPAGTIPVYWIFGKLEISFDEEAPHWMNWFQIEEAGYLEGDFEVLTDRLVLSLDGFSGETKPSEFLAAGLWAPEEAAVFYAALSDDILLNICAGPIQIHFRVDTDFIEDGDAQKYLANSTVSQVVSDIDSRATLDSIYSYPQPAFEEIPGAFNWNLLSGRDYLTLAR
ncbi:hypothetical protein NKH47_05570 [Mesorhizobium sp. M1060]|uniref:hypothetical protein n=1 Tax=unclassified Mesorhizobium TaxID=325217 RepID=UPI0012DCA051|nr:MULTISPECIES: hypothetical protein [unclassified Mesorhizobium]WJI52663.1 hypothetical protein NLY44_08380 [Mesorhizobium sp. C089B]WJI69479.1 hypothetical protein NLY36_01345 [Mesorhizobium sp. C399B]